MDPFLMGNKSRFNSEQTCYVILSRQVEVGVSKKKKKNCREAEFRRTTWSVLILVQTYFVESSQITEQTKGRR